MAEIARVNIAVVKRTEEIGDVDNHGVDLSELN